MKVAGSGPAEFRGSAGCAEFPRERWREKAVFQVSPGVGWGVKLPLKLPVIPCIAAIASSGAGFLHPFSHRPFFLM